MASTQQPQFGQPFPAPAQLALALVVLKSKPRESSVEDYLEQLRNRIVDGCAHSKEQLAQHVDSAGFWKEAFEKAVAEKTALLNKLHFYEKQNAAPTLSSSPSVDSAWTRDGKRRREHTPGTQENSRSKRRTNQSRILKSPARNVIFDEHGEELMAAEASDDTTKLLQAFYTLRLHLRSQPPVLSTIQASARQLCHTISATVRHFDGAFKPNKNRKDQQTEVWAAVRRTYSTLLEAVEILQANSSRPESSKTLIPELAKVFDELLNHLQIIAAQEQPQRRGLRKRSYHQDVDNPIPELRNLISGMILDLNVNNAAHGELFDGLMCTFLDHLGSNLSLAVFSDPIYLGLPQPVTLLPPRGFPIGPDEQTQVDISTTLKVAPHLINILRKIRARIGAKGGTENNDYARVVVDKMQNTLLRALFGEQDQAFRNSLRRPAEVKYPKDTEDLAIDIEDDVTSKWFIGEVWNLVGWDILTKHIT